MNYLEKIEEIKNNPDVTIEHEYSGDADVWKYFTALIGNYKGNYFRVAFFKGPCNIDRIDVASFTENRDEFMKAFGL